MEVFQHKTSITKTVLLGLLTLSTLSMSKNLSAREHQPFDWRNDVTLGAHCDCDRISDAKTFGYMGVAVHPAEADRIFVGAVQPNSPAAQCGLQTGDIIDSIMYEGDLRFGLADFFKTVADHPNHELFIYVRRNNTDRTLVAKIGSFDKFFSHGLYHVLRERRQMQHPDGIMSLSESK